MSDMKCPICGQELKNINLVWFCENESCRAYDWTMEESAWQELIRTRKALKTAVKSIKLDKEFAEYMRTELGRTCKALDIAVDALKLVYQGNGDLQDIMRYKDNRWTTVRRLCKQALDEITALEQKE